LHFRKKPFQAPESAPPRAEEKHRENSLADLAIARKRLLAAKYARNLRKISPTTQAPDRQDRYQPPSTKQKGRVRVGPSLRNYRTRAGEWPVFDVRFVQRLIGLG
jgi:hypothetical protein